MPPHTPTTSIPLFERLCGPAPSVAGERLDLASLRHSIAAELERLLTSRSRRTIAAFLSEPLTVLDYGLPDFGTLSPGSSTDVSQIRLAVTRAITCFEPRLLHPQVRAQRDAQLRHRIALQIDATVSLHHAPERLSFEISVGAGSES